jgi:hypothetical protein
MDVLETCLKVTFLADTTAAVIESLPAILLHRQHRVRVGAARLLGHILASQNSTSNKLLKNSGKYSKANAVPQNVVCNYR